MPKTGARPNVLFIWTDQQAAKAMGNSGNRWLNTPAMDELAAQGVTFEQTYCSDPICVPSRSSWLTGLMPHQTGVTFNVEEGRVAGTPLSRAFCEAGYVGKWHIPHPANDAAWHGFDFTRHMRNNRLDPDVLPACHMFLRTPRENPFFLVASFLNPHDICEWARFVSDGPDELPNGLCPPRLRPKHARHSRPTLKSRRANPTSSARCRPRTKACIPRWIGRKGVGGNTCGSTTA